MIHVMENYAGQKSDDRQSDINSNNLSWKSIVCHVVVLIQIIRQFTAPSCFLNVITRTVKIKVEKYDQTTKGTKFINEKLLSANKNRRKRI